MNKFIKKVLILVLITCFLFSFIAFLNQEFEYFILGIVAYGGISNFIVLWKYIKMG